MLASQRGQAGAERDVDRLGSSVARTGAVRRRWARRGLAAGADARATPTVWELKAQLARTRHLEKGYKTGMGEGQGVDGVGPS